MKGNILFYKNLPKHNKGLVDLLAKEQSFNLVPEDWYIFVVDIENSTEAVQNGMHEQVNLAATGSIVTVLNEIKKSSEEIRIPYFFGGDGTTFIIPSIFQAKMLSLLENYRHHVKSTSSLILRVGGIAVKDIYESNHEIKIAKLALTKHMTIPIVLGTGLKYAEKVIKSSFVDTLIRESEIESINLIGMQCRWNEVKPKEEENKIVCLLVGSHLNYNQAEIYKDIFEKIDDIFGNYKERNPISTSELKLDLSIDKIRGELKMKNSNYGIITELINWLGSVFYNFYFKIYSERNEYLRNIPLLADTIMIDGGINTVFSGTQKKIDKFITYIDEMEREGKITYGMNITHSSIMSCYVEDRRDKHIHFIDGTNGGYTKAALMYKSKIMKN
jgi:hypothetical protein